MISGTRIKLWNPFKSLSLTKFINTLVFPEPVTPKSKVTLNSFPNFFKAFIAFLCSFDNLSLLGLLPRFFSNLIVVFLSKPVRNNFRISDLKLQVYFATNSELFRISFGRGVKHKILSILFKGFL